MKKNLYEKIILPIIVLALMFMPGCGCGGGGGGGVAHNDGGSYSSVSVGTQSGILYETVGGEVSFTVTTKNIADDTYFVTVNNLPEGAAVQEEVTITDGSGELIFVCDKTIEEGITDTLTLTLDEVTSDEFTLAIEGTGDGTPETPFIVGSVAALEKIRADQKIWSKEIHYKQAADIDMSSVESWTPIGDNTHRFSANYDGDGYTISNLKIDGSNNHQGLFGTISGTVKNVKLTDADITGSLGVGGVVGFNAGTVENCSATGSVNGNSIVGGVVGYNKNGSVQNCYSGCDVKGYNSDNSNSLNIGGVVGSNTGMIENCYATGSVSGSNRAGGVVGHNDGGTVQNCYASGDVSSNSSASGGVAGCNQGIVENCVALNNNIKANFINTTNLGRVIGQDLAGTMRNNYGRRGMTLTYKDNTDPYTPASDADLKDGADVDTGAPEDHNQCSSLDFWRDTAGFNFGSDAANPWKLTGSAHPKLYWQ
jgi:hypothetical protein